MSGRACSVCGLEGLGVVLAALAVSLPMVSCSDSVTGPSDLTGGAWKLRSMELAGALPFVPADPNHFSVEFRDAGRIGVVADCNQCGGGYTVQDGTLTVTVLACTRVACATPAGGQFASLIEGTSSLESDGTGELEIEGPEGKALLTR
jgi:putative lipoprotein